MAIIREHATVWSNSAFAVSTFVSLLFLGTSLVINYYTGEYATDRASNPVTDLILSNIPVFNLGAIFVYGAVVLAMFVLLLLLIYPRMIPFTIKSVALFILTRSLFISLTHIAPFPEQAVLHSNLLERLSFDGDLFFSGHTGLPFLLSLVFWEHPVLRFFFILCSIFFGVVVLLAHLHYSIDVLAAFFITFSIYRLSELAFPHDQKFTHMNS
jgi:hypothetical protein